MITDPFFKVLYSKLSEEITNRSNALITGGSVVNGTDGLLLDPINTAIKYKADVVYLNALKSVLELCFEIDKGIYGKNIDGDD